MNNILFVFLGGGLGSVARYGVSEFVRTNFRSSFPIATLFSNVISCAILAFTITYLSQRTEISIGARSFIIVGICGGFSTFSTFSFETVELIRAGNAALAITNILISVTVCVALVYFLTKQA
ncbi:MAG: fluoride efflux transporter CrcB [Bacteroidetes bacterium]|nr:fluoride efflux transporter CrcB [Bacteroidota bacterium]